jgi:peroxiredoxin
MVRLLGMGAMVLSVAGPVSAVRPLPWDVLALEPAPAGIRAPDFALAGLNGNAVRRADLRGRWVLLNFWASWCTPCEMEMAAMQRLQARFKPSTLEIVAVNYREAADDIRRFAISRGIDFRVLLDPDGAVSARYQVGTLPFAVILNPRGEIVAAAEGPRDWASRDALRFFDGLIGRKP